MDNEVQNFTQAKSSSGENLIIEILMTIVFVSIIVFSCIVLFG